MDQNEPSKTIHNKRELNWFTTKISITSYLDYRDFLYEIYLHRKKVVQPFSYLQFAEELGFAPTNVIRLVISGKRSLAPKSAQKVAKSLGLDPIEKRYFLALVGYNDAKGPALKKKRFDNLLTIKQESLTKDKDRASVEYFNHWSRPVLREVLNIQEFQIGNDGGLEDSTYIPESAAARIREILYPELRTPKVLEAIKFLLNHGYLKVDEKGTLKILDAASIILPSDHAAHQLSSLSYHQQMLQVAQECLIKVPSKRREYHAMTLCLSQFEFDALRDQIRKFCASTMQMESEGKQKDRVVQFNIQLFSLTKPTGGIS
jgi:uncharacterized protein (TIGR02147 family)